MPTQFRIAQNQKKKKKEFRRRNKTAMAMTRA